MISHCPNFDDARRSDFSRNPDRFDHIFEAYIKATLIGSSPTFSWFIPGSAASLLFPGGARRARSPLDLAPGVCHVKLTPSARDVNAPFSCARDLFFFFYLLPDPGSNGSSSAFSGVLGDGGRCALAAAAAAALSRAPINQGWAEPTWRDTVEVGRKPVSRSNAWLNLLRGEGEETALSVSLACLSVFPRSYPPFDSSFPYPPLERPPF